MDLPAGQHVQLTASLGLEFQRRHNLKSLGDRTVFAIAGNAVIITGEAQGGLPMPQPPEVQCPATHALLVRDINPLAQGKGVLP